MFHVITYEDYKAVHMSHECSHTCLVLNREIPPQLNLRCDVFSCVLVNKIELAEWLYTCVLLRDKTCSG
jgi:hypothetical protein